MQLHGPVLQEVALPPFTLRGKIANKNELKFTEPNSPLATPLLSTQLLVLPFLFPCPLLLSSTFPNSLFFIINVKFSD